MNDTNLAGVGVGQVEGVAGELSTAIATALGEEAVVVACVKNRSLVSFLMAQCLGYSIFVPLRKEENIRYDSMRFNSFRRL